VVTDWWRGDCGVLGCSFFKSSRSVSINLFVLLLWKLFFLIEGFFF